MRIEELTAEQSVSLLANLNGEQLTFDTKIQEVYPKKRLVLAAPVYRDNKVISFHAKNLIVDLLVNMNDVQPMIFKNVTVTLLKKPDDSLCYRLETIAESKSFNRRQNFRCFIGDTVTMQCGLNHATCEAILRDISVTGFAVVCTGDVSLEENQVIHVLYEDFIEETQQKFLFHFYGIIVRTQELENGRILYGCRLNNRVNGLEGYIMIKERLRLKRTNGGKL